MTETHSICVNLFNNNGACTYSMFLSLYIQSLEINGLRHIPKMIFDNSDVWDRLCVLRCQNHPTVIVGKTALQ